MTRTTTERRHLTVPRGLDADSNGERPTKLVVTGTDAHGHPTYEEVPCISNDNPSPYKWECDVRNPLDGAVDGAGKNAAGGTGRDDGAGNAVGLFCPGAPASSSGGGGAGASDEVAVPYVYEVETAGASEAAAFLPKLEEQILLNLADAMMGCLKGERRARRGRRLDGAFEVVGIRSSPEDVEVTEGPCSISAAGADGCFLLDGKLTLVLDPKTEATAAAATDAAQDNLEEAMTNDELLSDSTPEVVKVRYLADGLDAYLTAFVAAGGTSLGSGAAVPGGTSGGKDDSGATGWIGAIAGAVGGALLVLLAALCFVRRRRGARKRAHHRRRAPGGASAWEGWDDVADVNDPASVHAALLAGRMGAGAERVMHVSNLNRYTSEEQVRSLFEQHGTVIGCFVPSDHRSTAKGALGKQDTSLYEDAAGGRAGCRAPDCSGCGFGGGDDNSGERYALLSMPARDDAENLEAESAIGRIGGLEVDGRVLKVQEVTTLYVGNLSEDTTEDDVRRLFEQHGTVIGCAIPADHDANDVGEDPNGRFALVTMPTDEAEKAMAAIQGMKVDGNKLTVKDARRMHDGSCSPGNGLALAALAVGAAGAVAAAISRPFNAQGNENVTLYVGPLSPDATEEGVRRVFEQYGTVIDCTMPPVAPGRERFALVTMPAADAERAMHALDGVEDDGLVLRVREARPMARALGDDASVDSSDLNYSADSQEEERPPTVLAAVGAAACFVAAPFLAPCKKRRQHDEKLAHLESVTGNAYAKGDDGLDAIIAGIDGTPDERNFVVDPEGAFHLGNHHYTAAGVRYFSPLCEQCLAYRAGADGTVALHALDDRDDSVDGRELDSGLSFDLEAAKKFTDFDSNDLGRYHSSMHVRHCKSTTCVMCQREKGVTFVKSRKEKDESLV